MDREFLKKCLAEGLSLEKIGVLVGRDSSTVGYHLKKHGLKPVGHDKHAPKGKVDPERLRSLIEDGATIREAAAELGVGYTTVRHWIKRLDLSTKRMDRLASTRAAIEAGQTDASLTCPTHGYTKHFRRPDGGYRCTKCRSDAVSRWRRRVKRRLIERAGGGCQLCGYDKYQGALQFHHLDPETKTFHLSRHGVTRSYAEASAEADKCVLLCANCHAEVEGGVTDLVSELGAVRFQRAASSQDAQAA
jgi:hypothetical protein